MTTDYVLLVGIDWASQNHQVCVLSPERKVLAELNVAHEGEAILKLADRLLGLSEGHPEAVAVGIETPHGPVVETLIERGFHV